MNKSVGLSLIVAAVCAMFGCSASGQQAAVIARLPAFPGAEGFGSGTPGGRGGKVLIVTNLNDAGPGSLRAALEADGPRIVVFRVSGTIFLQSIIKVRSPYLTIAGQTAPGGGICVAGETIRFMTHDVIVRGVRFRTGDLRADHKNKKKNLRFESVHVLGGSGREAYNVILDHCSVSWGIDKNVGIYTNDIGTLHDVTVQWCIISEGLHTDLHPKGDKHAMGLFFSSVLNATAHHNLFAHNIGRQPLVTKGSTGEVINNVVYNWGTTATNVSGGARANVINNYYKKGPDWNGATKGVATTFSNEEEWGAKSPLVYVKGNMGPGKEDAAGDEWNAVTGRGEHRSKEEALQGSGVFVQEPAEAYQSVLSGAGAFPRDTVDLRIVSDVRNGTGKKIVSQEDVGGWPDLAKDAAAADSDNDGMPDAWEQSRGLNPNDPSDASKVGPVGYTHIEEYVNGLMAALIKSGGE